MPIHGNVPDLYSQLRKTAAPGAVRGVGHRNEQTAALQYDQVAECLYGLAKPASVLDVGAGYGHLYEHLKNGWGTGAFKYTGVEQNKDTYIEAKKLHPSAWFINGDVREIENKQYDIVACVGTLAWYDLQDAVEIANTCWNLSTKAAIFIMHEDTTAMTPMELVEYLQPPFWSIDRSFDPFVAAVRMHREEQR